MTRDQIENEYFKWLTNIVRNDIRERVATHDKLLSRLYDRDFTYIIANDQNRAEEGEYLRYRFAMDAGYEDVVDMVLDILDAPCSVLEMMIALALHCEENIMDDPRVGNRTDYWFWSMITNLGLGGMSDTRYNRRIVDDAIDCFLNREYEPDGRGGLFHVRNCNYDMRSVEIWHQLCWYLDSIT